MKKIEVYKEVLYTITHKIGTGGARQGPGGGHSAASTGLQASPSKTNQQLPLLLKDELYSYARNAFGFSMPGHRKLLSLTAEQKVILINYVVFKYRSIDKNACFTRYIKFYSGMKISLYYNSIIT
jgi:hypothetical protein